MKKLILVFLFITTLLIAQHDHFEGVFNYMPAHQHGTIIHHSGYSLKYREKHEQPEWVAYRFTKEEMEHEETKKRLSFKVDPKVATGTAESDDYKNSGYSRGHLCPAEDKDHDKDLYKETFLMSNVSPQIQSFNGGLWKRLDNQVRRWAESEEVIYIVTGPVLIDVMKYEKIGAETKVSVPTMFYKVILDYQQPEIKAIAFLMENKKDDKHIKEFVVSIDTIEELTGIDFFPEIPDELENNLESGIDKEAWGF